MSVEAHYWSNDSIVNYYDNLIDMFHNQPDDLPSAHMGLMGDDGLSFPRPASELK